MSSLFSPPSQLGLGFSQLKMRLPDNQQPIGEEDDGAVMSISDFESFEFAFNSANFSDRVLRIEIAADMAGMEGNRDDCDTVSDWARQRKRRRGDGDIEEKAADVEVPSTCNIVDAKQPDTGDSLPYEILDDDLAILCPSGDERFNVIGNSCTKIISSVPRVEEIYVNSAILAARSKFFYKLFSNGMQESGQKHATLQITESEEVAVMELLSFMYSGKLLSTSGPILLDVLMAADKYQVPSCMRYCSRLLRSQSMTKESALLYLDLPSSVSMASAVKPLTDAAKKFLADTFEDLTKSQDEALNLPLAGIEAVLSSDTLQVTTEDGAFEFLLKWARTKYPDLEERKEIFGSLLSRVIRFPYLSYRKLRKVLSLNDMDKEVASNCVREALFIKSEKPYKRRRVAEDQGTNCWLVERAYKHRPVRIVEFELPYPQCIVYMDLHKEECDKLYPSNRLYSEAFHLCGHGFFLSAHCNMDPSQFNCFGLFLGMQEKGAVDFMVDYEFSARMKPTGEFLTKYSGSYTFTGGKAVGFRNLLGVTWAELMAEESLYFFNGILHLKAELTIRQPQSSNA